MSRCGPFLPPARPQSSSRCSGDGTGVSMRIIDVLRRLTRNSDSSAKSLSEAVPLINLVVSELSENSQLMNQRLAEAIAGIANQSELINRKLSEAVAGITHQAELVDRKLSQAIEGIANQTDVINRRLMEVSIDFQNTTGRLNQLGQILEQLGVKLDTLVELQKAEIVMQRDQAEAMDELAKILTGASLCPAGPSSTRHPE